MTETLYPRDSVTWRVNQEPALLLGGGRALLMQLAHPGVAAGVAQHSGFRQRPLRRLARTLELTLALTFGTRAQALAAAQRINAVHERVRGPGYSAKDPRLLLWVHATLIDSALEAYRLFVGPLTPLQRETYYREAKLVGGLLGIPNASYPPTFAAFEGYLESMLSGNELRVDSLARELAAAVLRPGLRLLPKTLYGPVVAVTAGLLPEGLRRAYELRWGRAERLAFGALRRCLPLISRRVPARVRDMSIVRRAAAAVSRTLKGLKSRSSKDE